MVDIKRELENLHKRGFEDHAAKIRELEDKLSVEVQREEQFWAQKARTNWLKWGDKNTSYFHAKVIQRRRKNNIMQLNDGDGNSCKDQSGIIAIALDYFKNIYKTCRPNHEDIARATAGITPKVTQVMNRQLIRPFSEDEIRKAAFAIDPDKAPGLDGMTGLFFQANWEVVKSDVCAGIKSFFEGNRLPQGINHTSITLIPKVQTLVSMADLRPISLCPVYYKILSRLLTNRLQKIIPNIISENQSAFTKGRNISDNIILAHELTHHLKTRRGNQSYELALKLDMSKAYERIEWIFVKRVLRKMGFHFVWIKWIMECISSVTYSLNFNGDVHGFISPSRGLRQGDPLSPLIFIMCAECFSALLLQAERNQLISGVCIAPQSPSISHLLFADDSLLFVQASHFQASNVKRILQVYCQASGQLINFTKSSIFFSRNTPMRLRDVVMNILEVSHVGGCGMERDPPIDGGREVLIKSIAMAIPVFAMSCFLLPKSLGKEINKILSNFWWGQKSNERKLHWVSWNKMCQAKGVGGIGFRDLEAFNLALLAKQGWKLLTQPDSLISKVFKGKYYPTGSFIQAGNHWNGSWAWKSFLKGREVLVKGIRWQVGNGNEIDVRHDPWLPTHFPFKVNYIANIPQYLARVSDFIVPILFCWNRTLVQSSFLSHDADAILALPVSATGTNDKLVWNETKTGKFTVGSAYHLAHSMFSIQTAAGNPFDPGPMNSVIWKQLWKLSIPQQVKIFIWKALNNGLASNGNIHRRIEERCELCPRCPNTETISHILLQCPFAETVWMGSSCHLREAALIAGNFKEFWASMNNSADKVERWTSIAWISWAIWLARNAAIFREDDTDPLMVLGRASDLQGEYMAANASNRVRPAVTRPEIIQNLHWQPPSYNGIKINFDGAVHVQSKICAGACVARDTRGSVLASFARQFRSVTSPALCEAFALREALLLAIRMRLKFVHFEGDAKSIIEAMTENKPTDVACEVVIQDCRKLSKPFPFFTFGFVNRSINWVAHSVAKKALHDSSFCCNSLAQVLWLEARLEESVNSNQ
ncbi:uncharacterized protein LOC126656807 [Mercurialis annua]|uniref:uncharacterized protein LOC126656807 n=1 Tax=Mercurialis annua TaxID=3986 RepID=UPI0021602D34|nr:uncharacterized protein LOC126656807 [Mercurialis annua]